MKNNLIRLLLVLVTGFSQAQKTPVHLIYCSDESTKVLNDHFLYDACPRGVKPMMFIQNFDSITPEYKHQIPKELINTKLAYKKKKALLQHLTKSVECDNGVYVNYHKLFSVIDPMMDAKKYCTIANSLTQKVSLKANIFRDPPYLKKYGHLINKNDGVDHVKTKYGAVVALDVSHHQGKINWDELSKVVSPEPVEIVIMKATEGGNYVDKKFKHNWAEAKKVGITRGAYHFFRPKTDPILQARNYINTVGKLEAGDVVPVIDVEKPCRGCSDLNGPHFEFMNNLKTFTQYIEDYYKVKALFYSGDNYYYQHVRGYFPQNYFWLARYSDVNIPRDMGKQTIGWQFTDAAKIDGIRGYVDVNVFLKSYKEKVIIK